MWAPRVGLRARVTCGRQAPSLGPKPGIQLGANKNDYAASGGQRNRGRNVRFAAESFWRRSQNETLTRIGTRIWRPRRDCATRRSEKITAAQEANEFDMNGHAAKAKELLDQASRELKLAAEAANKNAK
jgi:hypothetical protein